MSKKYLLSFAFILLTLVSVFVTSCKKDDPAVTLPTIVNVSPTGIDDISAVVGGFIVTSGNADVTERGIVYSKTEKPAIESGTKLTVGSGLAKYSVKITGLTRQTTYFVRSYAINSAGTIYGDQFSITTTASLPAVTTIDLVDQKVTKDKGITENAAGNITDKGGVGITIKERGLVISEKPTPTTADDKRVSADVTDLFQYVVGNLKGETKYYLRAYATNSIGTAYGKEVSFTTPKAFATAKTDEAKMITITSADISGTFVENSSSTVVTVTAAGVCYGTTSMPTLEGMKTTETALNGKIAASLTNLTPGVKYFARSYVINSVGTNYGSEINFETLPLVTTKPVNGTSVGATSAVVTGTYVNLNPAQPATSTGICWSTNEVPTINDFKTTNGGLTGNISGELKELTSGVKYYAAAYSTDGINVVYGKVVSFVTYPPKLYMIGSGVGSWTWEVVDLPMIPVNSNPNLFWKIVWLTADGLFKFAPGREWKNDFGKTGSATDGVFDKGGDNIPVPGATGYYMVVVDLSTNKISITTPKVYLMGDVIGGWSSNNANGLMTVDNTNEEVSITKELNAGEIRMYAGHPWLKEWWQNEFIILDGKIEFRGTGNDQTRVPITAGNKKVKLNFKTGTGSINAVVPTK